MQNKINSRYEDIEDKEQRLEDSEMILQKKEKELFAQAILCMPMKVKLKSIYTELIAKLENISAMTRDEAKKSLFETLEAEVRLIK